MTMNDISSDITAFIVASEAAGWSVRRNVSGTVSLDSSILSRYPAIPEPYMSFMSHVSEARSKDDSAWFLLEANYNGTSGFASSWNEWELFEIANSEGDQAQIAKVRKFWDSYFPIALSVRSDFAYLALDMTETGFGQVVHSFAPYLMEPETIFADLAGLLTHLRMAMSGEIDIDGGQFQSELADFL